MNENSELKKFSEDPREAEVIKSYFDSFNALTNGTVDLKNISVDTKTIAGSYYRKVIDEIVKNNPVHTHGGDIRLSDMDISAQKQILNAASLALTFALRTGIKEIKYESDGQSITATYDDIKKIIDEKELQTSEVLLGGPQI